MARANWLDAVIAPFAPGVAARRVRDRADFEKRAYAGSALGNNTAGWRTQSSSADSEIYAGGRRLRDRSRDLVRNNPLAAKAVTVLATNIIGDGIVPRPILKDEAANAKVKEAFKAWCEDCDADGQLDFYGLQTLAVRSMVEGGEILARRRWRRASDGYTVPVQIQIMEPDYLDEFRNGPLANGNKGVQGVEFDLTGKRAAYWMFPEHPGNQFSLAAMNVVSSRISADDVVHLYEKQRTQARGVPWAAPVIRRIRDVDDYDFAEGIRKKSEASLVAFVTSDDEYEEGVAKHAVDSRGNVIERFVPGMIAYLRGGKDVKFNAPATIGGYEEYKRVTAREIAAGYRVPYELITGDLSQVNFSSARVGIVEFRRFCTQVQWQIIIKMFLQPIWEWFCEAAWVAGEIDDPVVPVEWSPPKWPAIQPLDDAQADMVTIRNGLRSWADVVAERGHNPDDVLAEIAKFNAKMDDLGITLDSDPRRTSIKGAFQKGDPGEQTGTTEPAQPPLPPPAKKK